MPSEALIVFPPKIALPPILRSVENVETPVTLIPLAPTVNPPLPKVRFALSCKTPLVPAVTTLPDVRVLTVRELPNVETPETFSCLVNKVGPVTVVIPAKVETPAVTLSPLLTSSS